MLMDHARLINLSLEIYGPGIWHEDLETNHDQYPDNLTPYALQSTPLT